MITNHEHNPLQDIIDGIKNDYEFIGKSYDRKGNFLGYHYLYSKTFQAFPYQINHIRQTFPEFNITHLYLNWYIIGFNKKH